MKFVSVESGVGWIPFVLEALDYQFVGNRVREDRPDLDLLPSEYFARNVYACYWFEQTAPRRLLDKVGVDNILFETDFPHPTSLYGEGSAGADHQVGSQTVSEISAAQDPVGEWAEALQSRGSHREGRGATGSSG